MTMRVLSDIGRKTLGVLGIRVWRLESESIMNHSQYDRHGEFTFDATETYPTPVVSRPLEPLDFDIGVQ